MTLQGIISTLDNNTVVRIETWLEQKRLEVETRGSAINTENTTADDVATTTARKTRPGGNAAAVASSNAQGAAGGEEARETLLPAPSNPSIDSQESKMATTIQAQVIWVCM